MEINKTFALDFDIKFDAQSSFEYEGVVNNNQHLFFVHRTYEGIIFNDVSGDVLVEMHNGEIKVIQDSFGAYKNELNEIARYIIDNKLETK